MYCAEYLRPSAARFLAGTLFLLFVVGAAVAQSRSDEPSGFDFYVLALSWSPSYCAAEGERRDTEQCASGRPYAFVVHGLWPQFERGYPEFCGGRNEQVSRAMTERMLPLMPSRGLIRHQWRKHGTCTGLSQQAYFATVERARRRVAVPPGFARLASYRMVSPDSVAQAFRIANPGLDARSMAVTCDRRFLREVRVCLDKALEFRQCPEVARRACRAPRVAMPPIRQR